MARDTRRTKSARHGGRVMDKGASTANEGVDRRMEAKPTRIDWP